MSSASFIRFSVDFGCTLAVFRLNAVGDGKQLSRILPEKDERSATFDRWRV